MSAYEKQKFGKCGFCYEKDKEDETTMKKRQKEEAAAAESERKRLQEEERQRLLKLSRERVTTQLNLLVGKTVSCVAIVTWADSEDAQNITIDCEDGTYLNLESRIHRNYDESEFSYLDITSGGGEEADDEQTG